VQLEPQKTVKTDAGEFKIDFVVTPKAAQGTKVAVEIDGHDFHEKTKDQVASDKSRERSLIREGYVVLRFTGSEVFRNPRKCVNEVVAFIEKRAAS